jgi:hypothetical protein
VALIKSIWKIEFITDNGTVFPLLDYDDEINGEPSFPVFQQAGASATTGGAWSGPFGSGSARRPVTWARRKYHASAVAARVFMQVHPAKMPLNLDGKIRVGLANDEAVMDHLDAAFLSAEPIILEGVGGFATLTTYRVEVGPPSPVFGLGGHGIPITWMRTKIGEMSEPIGQL